MMGDASVILVSQKEIKLIFFFKKKLIFFCVCVDFLSYLGTHQNKLSPSHFLPDFLANK